jgi:anti-sigma B factor antagonist
VEIKLRRANTIYVIDIAGEMDLYNAFKLKDIVNVMLGRQIREFVINLDGVEYIDSSGIGALLSVHAELKKRGFALRLANVKGSVKRVIELTKLHGYLPICADVNEAMSQIRQGGNHG